MVNPMTPTNPGAPTPTTGPALRSRPETPRHQPPVRRRFLLLLVLPLVAFAALAGPAAYLARHKSAPSISVDDVAASEGTDVASLYLTLQNSGGDDRLVGITTPSASAAKIHHTDTSGRMTVSSELDVPSASRLRFRPGGDHIMLEGLPAPLTPGSQVTVRLQFETAPPIDVTAEVVAYQSLPERYPTDRVSPR